jgi:hypothetical protein
MSFRGKRELLAQVAPRYSSARHGQRSVILDEFVAVTGYDRKYAIRLLLGPIRPPAPIRRPRAAHYGLDVQAALSVLWSAANGICAKRLVPFLSELLPTLERHGHLVVTDTVRGQLLALSPATVDRLLRPLRQPHGLSTTKPGRLLKHQIPIRTFAEWTDVKPGFLEGDLVAHCGGTTDGAFLYTFTLTDIATTWTECLALLHHSQHGVVHALEQARRLFPFPILGIDTDNGSEFINEELLAYCDVGQITFTRGRSATKMRVFWHFRGSGQARWRPGKGGQRPPRVSSDSAISAWAERNPNARRAISRTLVFSDSTRPLLTPCSSVASMSTR